MVRKTYILAIFSIFVLSGCWEKSLSQLYVLESVIDAKTDSVFSVLEELRDESATFSEKDRMHYGLLRLKCQNILDLPFDSQDSIGVIVDYYSKNGSYNEALVSTYLQGRAYMVAGNEPMAMECFTKCLAMETPSDGKTDYIQLSKLHSQLCLIYRNQNLVQFELQELADAEKCAYLGGDSLLALTYEYLKVIPYYKEEKWDSVLYVTDKVRERYLALGMKDKAADVLYIVIDIHLKRKNLAKAKECLDIFEKESGAFDANGDIEVGREIYYYVKGNLYEALGQLDSAEYQYRRLLACNGSMENIEAASKGLLSVYRTIGNCDSIGKYADMYCETNDSVHKLSVSHDIARMKAMYDYSEYKKKSEEMKAKSEAASTKIRITILVVVCLSLCMLYAIYKYRRRKQAEIERLLEEYDRTLQMIEDLNDDKEEMICQHQAELEKIKDRLNTKGVALSGEDEECAINDGIISRFVDYADSMTKSVDTITTEDWYNLFVEIEMCDSKYMLLLSESGLSDNEKKIAVLMRLHFKDYQIKKILESYGSSLPNYKSRINKKLFNQSGAKTLRRLIYAWK